MGDAPEIKRVSATCQQKIVRDYRQARLEINDLTTVDANAAHLAEDFGSP